MIESTWFLIAIFAGWASFSLWAERRTSWGGKMGAVIIALLGGMVLGNLGVIPAWSGVHDGVFSYAVSIAVPLLLFQADIRKVVKVGPKILLCFLVGSLATVIGAIVGALVFNIGPETWKAYGMFTGTYIGGSLNLATVGKGLDIDPSVWVAINAADIIIFFIWMAFLFQAGKWSFMLKLYPHPVISGEIPESEVLRGEKISIPKRRETGVVEIAVVLGAAIVSAAAGEWLGGVTGIPGIIFVTTIALILAATTPINKISVAEDLGMWIITIFFVVIGGIAIVSDVIAAGPIVFAGALCVVLIHGIVLFGAGRILKLPIEYILLASNANIGGPTTAAPMATMYGWRELVLPGLLLGIVGYALGTYLGFGVAYFLKAII